MPEVQKKMRIEVPVTDVWVLVNDFPRWAKFMPGYQDMKLISEDVSIWKLKGDIGILSRIVEFDVNITERTAPDLSLKDSRETDCFGYIGFTLEGKNESVAGSGAFKAIAVGEAQTEIIINLNMAAGGIMGPMINAMLNPWLAKEASIFASRLKGELEEGVKSA